MSGGSDLSPRVREDEILGTCLARPEAMTRARTALGSTGEAFTVPGNQPLWEAMVVLHDGGKDPAELSALLATLERDGSAGKVGGVQRLQWLLGDQAPRVTVDRVAAICVELQRYRSAIEVRDEAAKIGRIRDAEVMADPGSVYAQAQAMRERAESTAAAGLRHPQEFAAALAQEMLDRKKHDGPAVAKLGIDPIDDALDGGIQHEAFVVFAGRPGEGKTALGLQSALNIAMSGHPCAFFSREMSGKKIADRATQILGRLEGRRLDQQGTTDSDARAWFHHLGRFGEMKNLRLDATTRNLALALAGVRAWLRTDAQDTIQAADNPDRIIPVVMLDYLQKFSLDGKWPSREREVAEMSLMLADFALDNNCAVIAMAQINRSSKKEKRRPQISDLRESGAIEQDASAIVLINQLVDLETDGQHHVLVPAEVIVDKNRFGPKGVFTVGWRPRSTRFESEPPVDWDWNKGKKDRA